MGSADKWNEMVERLSELELPVEKPRLQQTLLVYHYYSEMESGGHESVCNWLESYIKETGIDFFVAELSLALEQMSATHYAKLIQFYFMPIWQAYEALEKDETVEDAFIEVVETADERYHQIGTLAQLLEVHYLRHEEELFG
ncbi:hypothetical protein JCM19046_1917 [Bacillus sp. JCM 19046]|nr:hypothetical protein JCM19045_666 [Bacillus sp. JCM 19045]GAF17405.1 hypothetical protein JCM19046_1917 [Bacillus sp. JCM 19046]